ncbi:MAG: alcohol dehydrogenase [Gammaproteobacteria bacterium]|nr:alcohol dehydrogenase [Gammaproteobacteria bacterium]
MKSIQFSDYSAPLLSSAKDTPAPQGKEVLIKIDACGVCHSDVHLWEGFFDMGDGKKADLSAGRSLPFTLGHEIVGEVVAIGEGVKDASIGDRRVVFPWMGCGSCSICTAGDEHLCNQPQALGINVDGGYSEYVMVPHPRYLFDYGDIQPTLACTYACSGLTAYSALAKVKQAADRRSLLIIGAGGVGLAALAIAQCLVDAEIIVADIDQTKRETAKAAGADHVVDPRDREARKQIAKLTDGGTSAAVDFVGSADSSKFGVAVLGKGATLVIVGLFGGSLNISVPLFPLKTITVMGSYVGSLSEMRELMALARAGKVTPIPVEPRPLDQANAALEELRQGNIVGRVVLRP